MPYILEVMGTTYPNALYIGRKQYSNYVFTRHSPRIWTCRTSAINEADQVIRYLECNYSNRGPWDVIITKVTITPSADRASCKNIIEARKKAAQDRIEKRQKRREAKIEKARLKEERKKQEEEKRLTKLKKLGLPLDKSNEVATIKL